MKFLPIVITAVAMVTTAVAQQSTVSRSQQQIVAGSLTFRGVAVLPTATVANAGKVYRLLTATSPSKCATGGTSSALCLSDGIKWLAVLGADTSGDITLATGGKFIGDGSLLSGIAAAGVGFGAAVNTDTDTVTIGAGTARLGVDIRDLVQGTAATPTGAGNVYFYVSAAGALTSGKGAGITSAGTLTNISDGGDVTTPFWPAGSVPVAVCVVASSNYGTCADKRVVLSSGPAAVTASGTSCTITAITNGIITAATCI